MLFPPQLPLTRDTGLNTYLAKINEVPINLIIFQFTLPYFSIELEDIVIFSRGDSRWKSARYQMVIIVDRRRFDFHYLRWRERLRFSSSVMA